MTYRKAPVMGGMPPHEHEELATLLNTLADGTISEADERRLRAILDRGEPARRVFREFAALHAGLYWDYATLLAPALPPPPVHREAPATGGRRSIVPRRCSWQPRWRPPRSSLHGC